MIQMIRTYSEAIRINDFKERYKYLQLFGEVGVDTFGYDRYLNQMFYHDSAWRAIRDKVIVRDNGCDLADENRPIFSGLIVHHINPITKQDVLDRSPRLFDLDNLICVSPITHRAIHYGDERSIISEPTIRRPNDTCPWR